MAGCQRTPGPFCQEERPICVDPGTSSLIESPSPAHRLGPFSTDAMLMPHAVRYLDSEAVSYELSDAPRMCVPTSLSVISLAQMKVLAWLEEHRSSIASAERRFRVDRRAIAGAIAWEALLNIHGRMTEIFGRGVGPGKAHLWDFRISGFALQWTDDTLVKQVEEADWLPQAERLPTQTYQSRKRLLETPEGAITYIAAAMNAAAHLATRAGFPSIRKRPEILANFWQSKDLRSWQQHLAAKPRGSDFRTGSDPNRDMDWWVSRNLRYLEDGVGKPQFPDDPPVVPVIPAR
jgi:hypothetical protein